MQKKFKTLARRLTLPKLIKIDGRRRGSTISLILRPLFEHKNIQRLLGTNIAAIFVASSLVPNISAFYPKTGDDLNGQTINISTTNTVVYPTNPVKITQNYSLFHPGIDFDGITGDSIYPIMKGVVIEVNYSRFSYGNHILLDHGGGVVSLYAHLSQINVQKGDLVTNDQVIGLMGATGRAFGDHLHLEVYENGVRINPIGILR